MNSALFLSAVLVATTAFADDEKGKTAAPQKRPALETKRGVFVLGHTPAKDVAAVLAAHFKETPKSTRVLKSPAIAFLFTLRPMSLTKS